MAHHHPHRPIELLGDLETIRSLLDKEDPIPLLSDASPEPPEIPILSEIVDPLPPFLPRAAQRSPTADRLRSTAHRILHEVIADFTPAIEAELERRLNAHLDGLLKRRRP